MSIGGQEYFCGMGETVPRLPSGEEVEPSYICVDRPSQGMSWLRGAFTFTFTM